MARRSGRGGAARQGTGSVAGGWGGRTSLQAGQRHCAVHLQTSFKSIITALCGSPRRVSFMNGPGNTLGGVMYTTLFLMVTRNR